MDEQEQAGDNILEPIGRAAVEAVQGVGAELGAIFGGGEAEGPGAAIGRAAADIFDSPRDPAADAGGGESGGGGSTDPWDAPSGGEPGGIIEAYEREEANRLPIDETPPTGTMSEDLPDEGIPADAEIFISQ